MNPPAPTNPILITYPPGRQPQLPARRRARANTNTDIRWGWDRSHRPRGEMNINGVNPYPRHVNEAASRRRRIPRRARTDPWTAATLAPFDIPISRTTNGSRTPTPTSSDTGTGSRDGELTTSPNGSGNAESDTPSSGNSIVMIPGGYFSPDLDPNTNANATLETVPVPLSTDPVGDLGLVAPEGPPGPVVVAWTIHPLAFFTPPEQTIQRIPTPLTLESPQPESGSDGWATEPTPDEGEHTPSSTGTGTGSSRPDSGSEGWATDPMAPGTESPLPQEGGLTPALTTSPEPPESDGWGWTRNVTPLFPETPQSTWGRSVTDEPDSDPDGDNEEDEEEDEDYDTGEDGDDEAQFEYESWAAASPSPLLLPGPLLEQAVQLLLPPRATTSPATILEPASTPGEALRESGTDSMRRVARPEDAERESSPTPLPESGELLPRRAGPTHPFVPAPVPDSRHSLSDSIPSYRNAKVIDFTSRRNGRFRSFSTSLAASRALRRDAIVPNRRLRRVRSQPDHGARTEFHWPAPTPWTPSHHHTASRLLKEAGFLTQPGRPITGSDPRPSPNSLSEICEVLTLDQEQELKLIRTSYADIGRPGYVERAPIRTALSFTLHYSQLSSLDLCWADSQHDPTSLSLRIQELERNGRDDAFLLALIAFRRDIFKLISLSLCGSSYPPSTSVASPASRGPGPQNIHPDSCVPEELQSAMISLGYATLVLLAKCDPELISIANPPLPQEVWAARWNRQDVTPEFIQASHDYVVAASKVYLLTWLGEPVDSPSTMMFGPLPNPDDVRDVQDEDHEPRHITALDKLMRALNVRADGHESPIAQWVSINGDSNRLENAIELDPSFLEAQVGSTPTAVPPPEAAREGTEPEPEAESAAPSSDIEDPWPFRDPDSISRSTPAPASMAQWPSEGDIVYTSSRTFTPYLTTATSVNTLLSLPQTTMDTPAHHSNISSGSAVPLDMEELRSQLQSAVTISAPEGEGKGQGGSKANLGSLEGEADS